MDLIRGLLLRERAKFQREWEALRDSRPFPADVEELRDIPCLPDGEAFHRMDLYRPRSWEGPLTAAVNVHGGGLAMGCKEYNRWSNAELCRHGLLVFSAEYRLTPEHRVFDAFADVAAAVEAAARLAPRYGGGDGGLCLFGDSAGAYLIAGVTAMQRDPAMARAAGVAPPRAEIRALGLISGMFYTTRRDKIGLTMPKYLYGPGFRRGPFAPYLDPDGWGCLGEFPPALLVTSGADMLRRYTLDFARALERAGVQCRLMDYPADRRLVHAFSAVEPQLPESREVAAALGGFFKGRT